MYGLVYAFLRPDFSNLQHELDVSLAPFKRGGENDFPSSALAFDDATAGLRILHDAEFEYKGKGTIAWTGAAANSWLLDTRRLTAHLDALSFEGFSGKFAEIEPDFDRFVCDYTAFRHRDAKTGLYGSWLNALGRWDWWELGGRFNGVVTGERLPGSDAGGISSGANVGRDTLSSVIEAFGGNMPEAEAAIEVNVELASTLLQRLDNGEQGLLPGAIVLPYGSASDTARWFDSLGWRDIPAETFEILAVPATGSFADLAAAAYARFADRAVAGIAYHL